jgi:hypothetical protein
VCKSRDIGLEAVADRPNLPPTGTVGGALCTRLRLTKSATVAATSG